MAEMVKVTEILQKVTSSDDFRDFDGSPDSWFLLMVDKLEGRPSVPLLIREGVKPEDFDPLEILLNSDNSWRMGDGHHRLVTAILLGFDEVPVVNSYGIAANRAHEAEMPNLYTSADFSNAHWLAEQIGQSQEKLLEKEYQAAL